MFQLGTQYEMGTKWTQSESTLVKIHYTALIFL